MKLFLHKLTHWEYWPYQVIYLPVYFQHLYYTIKSGSFFYFSTSNPSFKNGGFFMDSKKEIYDLIPQKYYPKTILIKKYQDKKTVINKIQSNNIKYPFIVKPDAGLRGTAVKKIENQIDLENYIKKANFDYLVQQLIPYQNEIGLFYIKNPNQKKGKITGIVKKEFLSVIGDGKCNIKQLIKKNKRAAIQLKNLEKENNINTTQIISKGKTKILVPFGNHCRGAKFIDDSSKITPELTETINKICEQINGFYYGRLDIMFTDYNKLENQKEFQIVEINGAISEPTHIYDSKHNILFAWKTLCYHYSQLYKISKQNHKSGYSYLKTKQGFKEWKKHYKHYTKILKF